ncbi:MAG: RNA pyrophosphohydrolase [Rhizobiaceae bacterium]|nr:RNA pyrophosphohydrolase [Rhizobiaceae bacterium]
MADWRDGKPYRANVGICLINPEGLIWFGKSSTAGPEIVSPGREWQMPQGGIEETEDIIEAARRELWEETGATSIELIDHTTDWWAYEFPENYRETGHKLDDYRGQKQRWVLFRFTGRDDEFTITAEHTDEPQEFIDWRWLKTREAIDLSVDFKVKQYLRVFSAFSKYLV